MAKSGLKNSRMRMCGDANRQATAKKNINEIRTESFQRDTGSHDKIARFWKTQGHVCAVYTVSGVLVDCMSHGVSGDSDAVGVMSCILCFRLFSLGRRYLLR